MGQKGKKDSSGDEGKTKISKAVWPEAAPTKYEEKILSIVCGNSHLHWAVHEGYENDFLPILFWR
jgi:hypothetical protein